MSDRAVGTGLPAALSGRLSQGHWLRTAHRGAPEIASGNSRRAIEAALEYGVDLVEVDVHRSRDGSLVLWHDEEIVEENGGWRIRDEEFGTLKAALERTTGDELIDLEGAMALTSGRAGLMIDLKMAGLADAIGERVRIASYAPAVVCGDYWEELRRIKQVAPQVGTSLTLDAGWSEGRGPRVEEIDTAAVTVSWRIVDRPFVERLHARGIAVLVWTMDSLEEMRRLIALGVDGLTSNRSELFARV